ncbi:hypothetical protein HYALB_00003818 [Hymenoscyphus albidus]|uniref:Uncharacterized protein n=1 Tax=Hymenoscyphus albidus TaxID=595503 RepID=A0A9N9LTJ7_9HELO|nr:hypothetical protein HYALB_00003818 [Hymenoscyphus albidus]
MILIPIINKIFKLSAVISSALNLQIRLNIPELTHLANVNSNSPYTLTNNKLLTTSSTPKIVIQAAEATCVFQNSTITAAATIYAGRETIIPSLRERESWVDEELGMADDGAAEGDECTIASFVNENSGCRGDEVGGSEVP